MCLWACPCSRYHFWAHSYFIYVIRRCVWSLIIIIKHKPQMTFIYSPRISLCLNSSQQIFPSKACSFSFEKWHTDIWNFITTVQAYHVPFVWWVGSVLKAFHLDLEHLRLYYFASFQSLDDNCRLWKLMMYSLEWGEYVESEFISFPLNDDINSYHGAYNINSDTSEITHITLWVRITNTGEKSALEGAAKKEKHTSNHKYRLGEISMGLYKWATICLVIVTHNLAM